MNSTKFAAMFTMVNLLLGTGPLILPSPCQQAGILLSIVWICVIGFISFNSAQFIVEALARTNYMKIEGVTDRKSLLSDADGNDAKPQNLEIQEAIEIGQMASIVAGKKYQVFAIIILTLYMMGVMISKCIMTGNTLATVFEDVPVLNTIYIWLGVFFLSGALFSFKNVQQTKVLQYMIVVVRFVSILSMIFGAIYIIMKKGSKGLVPSGSIANFKYFPELFSNTIFGLLCHHSLPSIVATVTPSDGIKQSLRYGFLVSILSIIIIPITGIMAFGQDLSKSGQGDLKYYNFDFKEDAPPVYYLVSFYVFLNVAAIPILTIVLRNNILKLIAPAINSKQFSKSTLMTTLIILGIVLLVTLVAQHYIEYVLMFTGGICGVFILIIIPAFLVLMSRKKVPVEGEFKHQATLKHWIIPYAWIVFGMMSLGFNLTETILKLTK